MKVCYDGYKGTTWGVVCEPYEYADDPSLVHLAKRGKIIARWTWSQPPVTNIGWMDYERLAWTDLPLRIAYEDLQPGDKICYESETKGAGLRWGEVASWADQGEYASMKRQRSDIVIANWENDSKSHLGWMPYGRLLWTERVGLCAICDELNIKDNHYLCEVCRV